MRIVLFDEPVGDVVAREDQLGTLEAEFVLGEEGAVWYRHRADRRLWHAADNLDLFRQAALAWNSYSDDCAKLQSESEQSEVTDRLRRCLAELGVLRDRPDNLWAVLLEQVRDGLL